MATDKQDESQVGLPTGTKIGKYEVLERLAIGGQAIVYKCRDELLDRLVAVKQMSSSLAEDPKFLERFRKEAQILARLSSRQPNIVGVHDVIEDEKGLFLVMEYVEGQSLEQVLQAGGTLDARAGVQVLWRLAAALNDVHINGYIHRDIKPANVILQSGLRPKIMDFGVAASSSGQTSMVLGTTKYMAPELFEGQDVDGRCDMYSLGVMMYELLLGRERFNEVFAEIVRDRHSERLRWMKWHSNESVKAPALAELNPEIPQSLSHIVAKMMAKDPAGRYGSMEDLGRAIKMAFSPKAKAGGARAEGGAGGPAGKQIELEDSGVIQSPEGPNGEAHLPAAPETAPIPKASMSLTTKLILLGIIVASVAGTFVALWLRSTAEEKRQRRTAAELYEAGYELYNQRQYDKALDKFRQAAEFSPTPGARKAVVMGQMAHAWRALKSGEYKEAANRQEKARQAVNDIQRTEPADSDLYKWSEVAAKTVRDFGDEQYHVRRFQDTYLQAKTYVMEGKLDQAQETLAKTSSTLLPPDQKARFDELKSRINQERIALRFEQASDQARNAFQQGRDQLDSGAYAAAARQLARAQTAYNDLRRVIQSDRNAGGSITQSDWQQALDRVDDRLAQIQTDLSYARAMAKAESARLDRRRADQLAALKQAKAVKDTPEVNRRIKALEVEVLREEALALRDAGKTTAAIRALRNVLDKAPDDAEARRALDDLMSAERFKAMRDAGDKAAAAGDFAAALDAYLSAAEIRATPELQSRIANARFEIQWAEAQQLLDEGQYDQARKAFDAAVQHVPEQAARVQAVKARIDRLQRYEQLMTQGRQLLEESNWSEAREKFQAAGEVLPARQEQADTWASTAVCRNYIQRARASIQAEDFPAARGYLRLAADSARFEEDKKAIGQLLESLTDQT
jgi:serine/threonine protein kinase